MNAGGVVSGALYGMPVGNKARIQLRGEPVDLDIIIKKTGVDTFVQIIGGHELPTNISALMSKPILNGKEITKVTPIAEGGARRRRHRKTHRRSSRRRSTRRHR